jgi:hypothetical protein
MKAAESERHQPSHSSIDDVIDCYKKDVDRTLLRAALKLTPEERLRKLVDLLRAASAMREAGDRAFR